MTVAVKTAATFTRDEGLDTSCFSRPHEIDLSGNQGFARDRRNKHSKALKGLDDTALVIVRYSVERCAAFLELLEWCGID